MTPTQTHDGAGDPGAVTVSPPLRLADAADRADVPRLSRRQTDPPMIVGGADVRGLLPITSAPLPSFDLGRIGVLSVTCTVRIAADRIGFHAVPGTDTTDTEHYLTISAQCPGGVVTLIGLAEAAADRVLAVVGHAIADGLLGDLALECFPVPHSAGGESCWYAASAVYTDSEGERFPS